MQNPIAHKFTDRGAVVVTTRADITGFNNSVNFTSTALDGGGSISGDTATLTNNQTFEATSVYYNTPQSIPEGSRPVSRTRRQGATALLWRMV